MGLFVPRGWSLPGGSCLFGRLVRLSRRVFGHQRLETEAFLRFRFQTIIACLQHDVARRECTLAPTKMCKASKVQRPESVKDNRGDPLRQPRQGPSYDSKDWAQGCLNFRHPRNFPLFSPYFRYFHVATVFYTQHKIENALAFYDKASSDFEKGQVEFPFAFEGRGHLVQIFGDCPKRRRSGGQVVFFYFLMKYLRPIGI
jgi:hypothetical protein